MSKKRRFRGPRPVVRTNRPRRTPVQIFAAIIAGLLVLLMLLGIIF